MARRKIVDVVADDGDDDDAPPALQVDDELAQALGELDDVGSSVVRVQRVRDGKRPAFKGELSAAGFSLALLQQRFGAGEYILTVLDSARRYRKQSTVAVDEPYQPEGVSAAPSEVDKLIAVMQASIKQNQEMMALMMQRAPAASAPAVDPQAVRQNLLQDLALMKQLVGGNAQQGVGPDKLIEVLRAGMDIARDAAGGGESDVLSVVNKVVDVLGEPLADLLRQRTPMVPAGMPFDPSTLPVAGALPVASPSEKKQEVKPKGGAMNMQQAVGFLVGKAAAGADPGLYADLVLDNVPDVMLQQVLAGDPVAMLAKLDPRVLQHAEWFRELGALLSEALRPDDAGTGSDSPTPDGHTAGNPARS